MAFGNYNNNTKDSIPSVNTRSYQFTNKNGFDPSALSVGYWNEMLSLRINPALEPSKQTDNKVFDYEKTVSTSLTLEKIMLLMYKITKNILPAITNDEDKAVGIQVGGDTLVVVGTGKKQTGSIRPYIAIHKSVHPDTKKPEMSIFYEFKTAASIDDYDETTGEYALVENIQSELMLFVEILKAAIIGLSNSVAHSERSVNKWQSDKTANTINAIAEKIGASTGTYQNKGGFQKSTSVSWGNRPSTQSNNETESVSVEELSNIEDINQFLS